MIDRRLRWADKRVSKSKDWHADAMLVEQTDRLTEKKNERKKESGSGRIDRKNHVCTWTSDNNSFPSWASGISGANDTLPDKPINKQLLLHIELVVNFFFQLHVPMTNNSLVSFVPSPTSWNRLYARVSFASFSGWDWAALVQVLNSSWKTATLVRALNWLFVSGTRKNRRQSLRVFWKLTVFTFAHWTYEHTILNLLDFFHFFLFQASLQVRSVLLELYSTITCKFSSTQALTLWKEQREHFKGDDKNDRWSFVDIHHFAENR